MTTTDTHTQIPDTTTSSIRASDTERERVSVVLHEAATTGRLTILEIEERLGILYTTRYRDELAPLISDLPAESDQQISRRPESIRSATRQLIAASTALLSTLLVLAHRHRRITAAVIIAAVITCASLIAFVSLDFGDHHEFKRLETS